MYHPTPLKITANIQKIKQRLLNNTVTVITMEYK